MRLIERLKIDIQPDGEDFDHHTDFLSSWSNQLIMNLTTLFSCPILVSLFIRGSSYSNFMSEEFIWLLNLDILLQGVQAVFVFLITWIPARTQKASCYCWFKAGPIVFNIVNKALWLAIPILSIAITVWKLIDGTIVLIDEFGMRVHGSCLDPRKILKLDTRSILGSGCGNVVVVVKQGQRLGFVPF